MCKISVVSLNIMVHTSLASGVMPNDKENKEFKTCSLRTNSEKMWNFKRGRKIISEAVVFAFLA